MSSEALLLAIDVGTGSCRAVIDVDGNVGERANAAWPVAHR
jgi:sugar (pentulose or hexulose) kinase